MGQVGDAVGSGGLVAQNPGRASKPAAERPLFVYSLRDPRLRLRNPIAVSLVYDGAQNIATSYDLDVFGYGETEGEALDDLRHAISDLYFVLKESSDNLGPLPQRVWEYLADTVEEKHIA